ncbi:MAG: hypothetical protein AAFZ58_07135 [Pseudomonadota bacterium]
MKLWQKILLIIEVLICFGPIAFYWLLGVLIFFDSSGWVKDEAMFAGFLLAGAAGVTALIYVLWALLTDRSNLRLRALVFVGIAAGMVPLIWLLANLWSTTDEALLLLALLPLGCACHLLYVARRLLFGRANAVDSPQPD